MQAKRKVFNTNKQNFNENASTLTLKKYLIANLLSVLNKPFDNITITKK